MWNQHQLLNQSRKNKLLPKRNVDVHLKFTMWRKRKTSLSRPILQRQLDGHDKVLLQNPSKWTTMSLPNRKSPQNRPKRWLSQRENEQVPEGPELSLLHR
jgi:hypothetical protein